MLIFINYYSRKFQFYILNTRTMFWKVQASDIKLELRAISSCHIKTNKLFKN